MLADQGPVRGVLAHVSMRLASAPAAMVTSRAAQPLGAGEPASSYAGACDLLAPRGRLVNPDHVDPEPEWDRRLRPRRPRFMPRSSLEGSGS